MIDQIKNQNKFKKTSINLSLVNLALFFGLLCEVFFLLNQNFQNSKNFQNFDFQLPTNVYISPARYEKNFEKLEKTKKIKKNYKTNSTSSKETPMLPLKGSLTSCFGYRFHPITQNLDFHRAIDISAPKQTQIHPILDGKVTETGFSSVDGNYIVIKHKNNIESKYCHCETILKKNNARVNQNSIISTVGSTGLATGPHLHLEIKINNTNIDPLLILKIN